MKLFYSPPSPFVRKVLVSAHELGLRERIELLPANAHPVNRDPNIVAHNPLGKIPTLVTDDGETIYDSRVVCEYLNALARGNLIPTEGKSRWGALVEQALADGMMDAAVLARYETAVRPEPLRWNDWTNGQLQKVASGLAELERSARSYGESVDIGKVAVGCALGYLDFRFASLAWREKHPTLATWFERFGARPSMVATRPA